MWGWDRKICPSQSPLAITRPALRCQSVILGTDFSIPPTHLWWILINLELWLFQGGTSFVDLLCFFLSCVCYVFVCVCLYVLCGHRLGMGWRLGSRLWCLTVSLSLSHWYSGSGVLLDCIDSWSLHPYLLRTFNLLVKILAQLYFILFLNITKFRKITGYT